MQDNADDGRLRRLLTDTGCWTTRDRLFVRTVLIQQRTLLEAVRRRDLGTTARVTALIESIETAMGRADNKD